MLRTYALTLAFVFISALSNAQDSLDDQTRALIARAASLELKTKSVPPPGNPLEHHASGFAKVLCSAVFVTGLDPDFAAESIGYFTAPYEERAKMKWRVDRENKAVHVTLPNGVTRTAMFIGDLGCLTLPRGESSPFFELPNIESSLPDAAITKWPMGDVLPGGGFPANLDATAVAKAVDAAFEPRGRFDGGLRRHLERTNYRRAVSGWNHDAHAFGKLVHGRPDGRAKAFTMRLDWPLVNERRRLKLRSTPESKPRCCKLLRIS